MQYALVSADKGLVEEESKDEAAEKALACVNPHCRAQGRYRRHDCPNQLCPWRVCTSCRTIWNPHTGSYILAE